MASWLQTECFNIRRTEQTVSFTVIQNVHTIKAKKQVTDFNNFIRTKNSIESTIYSFTNTTTFLNITTLLPLQNNYLHTANYGDIGDF